MPTKNLFVSLISIFVAIILVSVLWKSSIFLIGTLLLVTIIKHYLAPVPRELSMYLIVGILGPVTEGLIIPSGAWSYSITHLGNIPIWLPFLWGLAGTIFVTIYHSLSSKSK